MPLVVVKDFFMESEDHFSIMTTPSQSNNLFWDALKIKNY